MFLAATLLAHSSAQAQIYACIAEDGTRVFSDERCGPDAKVVPGISTRKRSTAPRIPKVVKPKEELEALSLQCDAGDIKACKEWTLGGGPALLRDKERKAELECEAGSLKACEERYCRDGLDEDCRSRVLRTAPLAGETWYLREESSADVDGLTRYAIRCVPENATQTRDITVQCTALSGPNRCYAADPGEGFARLDVAATESCSH